MIVTFLLWFLVNQILVKSDQILEVNTDEEIVKLDRSRPIVCISDGCIRGVSYKDYDGFLGIPYAKAPVGNLRFKV
jgi:carboxylesterase type B